jgi:ribosomal-protein-alanine N-acetyltransferase
MKFLIELMTEGNLPDVLALEKETFPDPWTLGMFQEELSREAPSLSLVARDSETGKLLGYLNGITIYDEFHIGNIAVRKGARGQGIGEVLLRRALDHAWAHSLILATLEVRMSNQAAISLYEKLGFRSVAMRKRYYVNEDALVMVLDLSSKPGSKAGKA